MKYLSLFAVLVLISCNSSFAMENDQRENRKRKEFGACQQYAEEQNKTRKSVQQQIYQRYALVDPNNVTALINTLPDQQRLAIMDRVSAMLQGFSCSYDTLEIDLIILDLLYQIPTRQ